MNKFEGKPCRVCGGTARYVSSKKCVACVCARAAKWREKYPDRVADHLPAKRAWRRGNQDYWIKRKFGIDAAAREAMWHAQGGRCGICREPLRTGVGGAAIDHNHSTGKVRALLCRGCNLGLGHFTEDRTKLTAAISYLDQHGASA